jgi:hypothetical protein
MADSNVLESLPDRAMKRSEIENLGESDAVEWVEVLRTGEREHRNMARAWTLQADGTAHVLLYEIEGWASQGSFDAEGMTDEEKRERSLEILEP